MQISQNGKLQDKPCNSKVAIDKLYAICLLKFFEGISFYEFLNFFEQKFQ